MNRFSWLIVAGAALIVAATFAAYDPAAKGALLFDDSTLIEGNPALYAPSGLGRIWFERGAIPQYYPLTHTSWWLQAQTTGLDPLSLHLGNVFLHVANALLLWWLLARLKMPGAWIAAALFALHPVNAESVAWISERKNVLSGLFFLGSLHAFLSFLERPTFWFYIGSIAAFVLALLSKSSVAFLPAALIVLLWWREGTLKPGRIGLSAPFFAIAAASAIATVFIERAHVRLDTSVQNNLAEQIAVAGFIPWFYAAKLIWPFGLAPIYARWDLNPNNPLVYLPALGVLAVLVCFWHLRDRIGRTPLALNAYFLLALAPTMGFFYVAFHRFSFVSDHFAYMASMGFLAGLVCAAGWLARRLDIDWIFRGEWSPALAALPLVPLLFLTRAQSANYADSYTFWTHAAQQNPNAWVAHLNLGVHAAEQGWYEEARTRFKTALRFNPQYSEALSNLATLLAACPDPTVRNPKEAVRLAERLCATPEGRTAQNLYTLAHAFEAAHWRSESLKVLRESRERAVEEGNKTMLAIIDQTFADLKRK